MLIVLGSYTAFFSRIWAEALSGGYILAESDLFEYYLPVFLAPITTWSHYEFSGLPAFADPGDFTQYPLHFVFARIVGSWPWLAVSAYVLAASFTYAYVYRLTRSKSAAAFAGLAYGLSESMVERLPHLGTLHAFAWLPLILLALEGLRGEFRRRWVAVGALGVACCILAGHPQPAVYTSYLTLLYAIVGWKRDGLGRPYLIATLSMFALGGLLSAVKLLPLVEASFYMARQEVSYGNFLSQSHTAAQMLGVLFPTIQHNGREAPLYVGLGTLLFASIGALGVRRNWRIGFWLGAALFALCMGAGSLTPVARIAFYLPLYDKFRVSPRHLFLFAFGAATLAGFGIAAVQRRDIPFRSAAAAAGGLLMAIVAGAALMAAFPAAFAFENRQALPWSLPVWNSGIWVQLGIAVATAAAALLVVALATTRVRRIFGVLTAVLCALLTADLLYSQQYYVTRTGLHAGFMAPAILRPSLHAVGLGRALAPTRQRLLAVSGTHRDAVVPAAWARVWQIPIAGGYGPMLLARYSALATMGTNGAVNTRVLSPGDAALDLLAVKDILIQPDDYPPPPTFERAGLTWSEPALYLPIGRDDCGLAYARSVSLPLPRDVDIREVAVVAALRCGEDEPQGTEVAAIEVIDPSGTSYRQPLRAGIEISEQQLDAPGVRAAARHTAAPLFDDPSLTGVALTRMALPAPVRNGRLVLHGAAIGGWSIVYRLTVVDAGGHQLPQSIPAMYLRDEERWREVERFSTSRITDRDREEEDGGETRNVVYENLRAMPRAWVASRVVPLDERDMLAAVRHAQLPDGTRFDPRRLALVDAGAAPAATFPTETSSATVTDIADGRIAVDVEADGGGFLVLSESWYPAWRARIDGRVAPVLRADVSLQGVTVPPGRHRVVFELASTTLRAGTALSLAGLLCVAVLLARRPR